MAKRLYSNPETFSKNFNVLKTYYPELAIQLLGKTQTSSTCLYEINNHFHAYRDKMSLYDSKAPYQEAKEWKASLDLSEISSLYIYGIGLGYYYEAIKDWLEEDTSRFVIFLEDELEVIHLFLQLDIAEEILKHPQIQLHYFQKVAPDESPFNYLFHLFATQASTISALKSYSQHKADLFSELKNLFITHCSNNFGQTSEMLYLSPQIFSNIVMNLTHLDEHYLGENLFGKFQGIPAIITGAGPSLKEEVPILKQLVNRALIFGGGTSLRALSQWGIEPHFGAGIDPLNTHYETTFHNVAFEVPFFYKARIFPGALNNMHGPKLYLNGTNGYPILDWVEDQLNIQSMRLDDGHNVVNLMIEIAHALGCNPIILVGCNLAYLNGQSYASEVSGSELLPKTVSDNTRRIGINHPLIKKDSEGKPVLTLAKWSSEAKWIEDYARIFPQLTFYNCTRNGLNLEGLPYIPLEKIAKTKLTKSYPIKELIHAYIYAHSQLPIDKTTIHQTLLHLQQDLEKAITYVHKLAAPLSEIAYTLAEFDLSQTLTYQYILPHILDAVDRVVQQEQLRLKKMKRIAASDHKPSQNTHKWQFIEKNLQRHLEVLKKAIVDLKPVCNGSL